MIAEDVAPGIGTETVLQTPLLGVGADGVVIQETEDADADAFAEFEILLDLRMERSPGLTAVDKAHLAVEQREAGLGDSLEILTAEAAQHEVVLIDTFRRSIGSHGNGLDTLRIELAKEVDDRVGSQGIVEIVLVVAGLVTGEIEAEAAHRSGRIRRGRGRHPSGLTGKRGEGGQQEHCYHSEQVCHSLVEHFKFFV